MFINVIVYFMVPIYSHIRNDDDDDDDGVHFATTNI